MKNKTLATWLALVGGPLGLHRFYLRGIRDVVGWLLPVPSLLGVYGVLRMRALGVDDPWIWWLLPLLGFIVAGCALTAIMYGLKPAERWNLQFNPATPQSGAGESNWLTIGGVVAALLIGTIALMAALALGMQGLFESRLTLGSLVPEALGVLRTASG